MAIGAWCLAPKEIDKFKEDIISGKIDPAKLSAMSSAERRAFFTERFGEENGEQMNRQLETKFLLKNQQQGYISWANKLMNVPPKVKRDIISKIERMDKVLDAADEKAFLNDLAAHKLGTRVSYDEAQTIAAMSKAVANTKATMESGERRENGGKPTKDELAYGHAVVNLVNYVGDLKREAEKTTWADIKKRPGATALELLTEIPGATKGMRATLDNSAIFRQGWKVIMTNPIIWGRNSFKTFKHLWQTLGGKKVMDEINAGIVSDPNYDRMKKAKLDVASVEEDFPSSIPEKIYGYRRLYKASETAFSGFQHQNRADIFNKMMDIADSTGESLSETDLINVGRMVNALTGRGNLGQLEQAGRAFNTILFSPKFAKSHIDVLTQPFTGGATVTEAAKGDNRGTMFVRKQAAMNLTKIVLMQAVLLALAKAFLPDDAVELDPRSSDFGKIKLGKTRFDISGGSASLIILAARILTGSSKSTTNGKISDLRNPEYGQRGVGDVFEDFLANKLSPVASMVSHVATQKTFEGKKPTVGGELMGLTVPMPIENIIENYDNKEMSPELKAASIVADMLGISSKTYKPFPKPDKQPRSWKQVLVGGAKFADRPAPSATDDEINDPTQYGKSMMSARQSENIIDLRPGKPLYPVMKAVEAGNYASAERLAKRVDRAKLTEAEREELDKMLHESESYNLPDNWLTLKGKARP